jgi:hypothetical protein
MICTKCKSYRIRRIKREGFLRRKLAPLFGFFPWRCSTCGTVQLLRARGRPARRRNASNPHGEAQAIEHANCAEGVLVESKQSDI